MGIASQTPAHGVISATCIVARRPALTVCCGSTSSPCDRPSTTPSPVPSSWTRNFARARPTLPHPWSMQAAWRQLDAGLLASGQCPQPLCAHRRHPHCSCRRCAAGVMGRQKLRGSSGMSRLLDDTLRLVVGAYIPGRCRRAFRLDSRCCGEGDCAAGDCGDAEDGLGMRRHM